LWHTPRAYGREATRLVLALSIRPERCPESQPRCLGIRAEAVRWFARVRAHWTVRRKGSANAKGIVVTQSSSPRLLGVVSREHDALTVPGVTKSQKMPDLVRDDGVDVETRRPSRS